MEVYSALNDILNDYPAGSEARADALEEYAQDEMRDAGDHMARGNHELFRACCARSELAQRLVRSGSLEAQGTAKAQSVVAAIVGKQRHGAVIRHKP
jgi:hypothetical protein